MSARRPSFTDLLDHAEGRLSGDRSRWVASHVATDEQAARTLAWIEEFLHDARRMPLVQPPTELSARLRSMFSGQHAPVADERWTDADLLHDTRVQAAAGTRSGTTAEARHLAFDSPAGRFIVEVARSGEDTVDLAGLLLLAGGDDGIDLTFLEAGVVRAVARSRRDGHFEVAAVAREVDELRLTGPDVRLRVRLDLRDG